jgi:hypothetical protein
VYPKVGALYGFYAPNQPDGVMWRGRSVFNTLQEMLDSHMRERRDGGPMRFGIVEEVIAILLDGSSFAVTKKDTWLTLGEIEPLHVETNHYKSSKILPYCDDQTHRSIRVAFPDIAREKNGLGVSKIIVKCTLKNVTV